MYGLKLAPLAPLLELDLALNEFFVLGRPVVDAFALGTGQFDESVLGHIISLNTRCTIAYNGFLCNCHRLLKGTVPMLRTAFVYTSNSTSWKLKLRVIVAWRYIVPTLDIRVQRRIIYTKISLVTI